MRCVKLESITAHLTHMSHAYTYHMRISTTMCVCLCMLCNKAADCDSTACDNRRCHCHTCLSLQPFSLLPPMLLPAAASNYCRCLPSSAFPHASEHYHAHGHWTLGYAPNIFLHNCAKCGDMPCRRSSCLLFACHVGTSMVSMSTESKQVSPAKQHTMDKSSGRGQSQSATSCCTVPTVSLLAVLSFSRLPLSSGFMLTNWSKSMSPTSKDFIPACSIRSNMIPLNVQSVVYFSKLALDSGRGNLGTWNFNALRMDVASCTFPMEYFAIHK